MAVKKKKKSVSKKNKEVIPRLKDFESYPDPDTIIEDMTVEEVGLEVDEKEKDEDF